MDNYLGKFKNIGKSVKIKILIIIDDLIPDYFIDFLNKLSLEEKAETHIFSTINAPLPADFSFIKNLCTLDVTDKQRVFQKSTFIIFQSENLELFWQVCCVAPIFLFYYKSSIINQIKKDNSFLVFAGSDELFLLINTVTSNYNKNKSLYGFNIRKVLHDNFKIPLVIKPKINKQNIAQINSYDYLRHKIIWVNPSDIIYGQRPEFYINYFSGKVYDGDWDKDVYVFDEEMLFYKSYQKR